MIVRDLHLIPVVILLLAGTLTAAAGCNEQSVKGASAAESINCLGGGDTRAWLTDRGDHAATGYCDADLALPLDPNPKWEYSYTSAEFSRNPVRELAHYDGRLVCTALSAQVLGLNPSTGEELFNIRISDREEEESHDLIDDLRQMVLTPSGLLACKDSMGYVYFWNLDKGIDGMLWTYRGQNFDGAIAASEGTLFFGTPDSLMAFDQLTGEQQWKSPKIFQQEGIVRSEDGTIITWPSNKHRIMAYDDTDGSLIWARHTDSPVDYLIIDSWRGRALAWLHDERMLALDLNNGNLEWDYDWSWVLDPDKREEFRLLYLGQTSQETENNEWKLYARMSAASVGPERIIFTTLSGDVICLTREGALLWHYKSQAVTDSALLFNNGVILREIWLDPQFNRPFIYPITPPVPDWESIARNRTDRREDGNVSDGENEEETESAAERVNRPQIRAYSKIVVLDLTTGELISVVEPEKYAFRGMIPAEDCVVYGEVSNRILYFGEGYDRNPIRILGFPWINTRSRTDVVDN